MLDEEINKTESTDVSAAPAGDEAETASASPSAPEPRPLKRIFSAEELSILKMKIPKIVEKLAELWNNPHTKKLVVTSIAMTVGIIMLLITLIVVISNSAHTDSVETKEKNKKSLVISEKLGRAGSFDIPEEDSDFAGITSDDIALISFNDGSVPSDIPVDKFYDKDELDSMIGKLRNLVMKSQKSEVDEANIIGSYNCYTIYYNTGRVEQVVKMGSNVFFRGSCYKYEGNFKQLHKETSEIYINDISVDDKDMHAVMTVLAFDEENTLIRTVDLSRLEGESWTEVFRSNNKPFNNFRVSQHLGFFDLTNYRDITPGTYRASFEITYPSGRSETKEATFFIYREVTGKQDKIK